MHKKRSNLCKTALIGFSLLFSPMTLAQSVTLTLDNAPRATITPDQVGGFNFGNFMNVVDFQQDLLKVAPQVIRFPGGNIGDERNLLEADLNILKSNWILLGKPKIVIQTRVFARPNDKDPANTPEGAANLVKMAKDMEIPVWYWEIGNEPDLYSVTRADPTWTPERYCDTFRGQREAMLKVDPSIKFVGPSISGAGYRNFVEGFVKKCGDIVDVLSWHIYPTDGSKTDAEALKTVELGSDDLTFYKNLWKDPERNPLGHQRQIEFGITEYGLSWKSPNYKHLTDQVAGLWTTETLLRMAEGGVKLLNYFALQGTQGHGIIGDDYFYRPTYYAFRLLRDFHGTSLGLASSDPEVWSHAVERDGTLQVILMNTSTAPKTVGTDFAGWKLAGSAGFTEKTVKDEEDYFQLQLQSSIELPARSMVKLTYSRP